jgi:Uma2 family endonuclease
VIYLCGMAFYPPADLADRNTSSRPYREWVRGRFYPEVSPHRAHGRLQMKLGALLLAWGERRGVVASEVDTNVTPEADDTRRYLPDVGFWSFERLRATGQSDSEVPQIPPDLAVEILSPTDDRRYLAEKVTAYLNAGSTVVLVVDGDRRAIAAYEHAGERELAGDAFEHPGFPGFHLSFGELFSVLDQRQRGGPDLRMGADWCAAARGSPRRLPL